SHNDDQGHLINRQVTGDAETPVAKAGSPLNFLAWYPAVSDNVPSDNPPPPAPVAAETTVGDPMTPGTLIGDFTAMISGVQERGCGFEAQNEAWYRFLVQPDPFTSIQVSSTPPQVASLHGYDSTILQQRKAFLRPDSLLAIIVVTDENEEVANPLSVGGEGYLYEGTGWPNSPSSAAPEGTRECASNPLDPNCTSCAFSNVADDKTTFPARCPNDPPTGSAGYLDATDDSINVRFFHQKQRFGVFAGYPVSRYLRGLTQTSVPDRDHEVEPDSGNYVGEEDMVANCVNPIFASNLPADATDPAALCNLARGPRTPDLVYYAAIAGVPHQLLQARAGVDPECPPGTAQADCPQKGKLTDDDWLKITGKDPENYDFTGADFHMVESETPRGSPPVCPPAASDSCDPINGREWNSNKGDLQFACTFQLTQPKDCSLPQFQGACDCYDGPGAINLSDKPLCQKTNGSYTAVQTYGKTYPSVREMVIAHAMGDQGIVSSMCPIHTTPASQDDPVFGYRPAVNAIINRLKAVLNVKCLPERVKTDVQNSGKVPCLVLVTLPSQGDECAKHAGLSDPPPDVVARFRADQRVATLPVCELRELTIQQNQGDFGADGTCSASADPGWCYVEGPAAGSCSQQLLFTATEPPTGAKAYLQCTESVRGVTSGM
ncbi:MAG TPA: hypothetical protein VN894_15870, partial [Polyangiaceae bacterium]|nr:hypothetical protein [Polyangiaceae bacterium]